jgi:predicted nucleic acid-binding protein
MPAALFLDTCALLKRYVHEDGSEKLHALVGPAEFRGRLFVCEHVEGEVLSALNRKLREVKLTRRGLRNARSEFYTHYPAIFGVVPLTEQLRQAGIDLLLKHPAHRFTHPDALHLAAALYVAGALPDPDLVLVSSDRALRNVAKRYHLQVFDPERDDLARL